MNPTAIYSKSGRGVQEASGKTSLLKRPDRAVLSAIDGRATLTEVAQKVGRPYDGAFQAVIQHLDKEGFIREVSAGAAAAAPPAHRPSPAKPAAKGAARAAAPVDPASDLDFSSLGASKPTSPVSRPAAPASKPPSPEELQQTKAQQSALDKAREEAEAKAAAERERLRREAEAKAKAEIEAKMRADAEKKMKEEAEARARAAAAAEAEAKIKAAREAALRAAAEAKAKAEAEAKAKAEAQRKAEEERRAREEMERRLEEERKARLEEEAKRQAAERKAREEAERARREAEEKARREAEELRQRLEAERKAREEAERKAREQEEKAKAQAERMRRELEAERQRLEEERRKEEEERAARRKQRDEEQAREREEAAARAATAAAAAAPAAQPEAPKAPAKAGGFADSLMADLDSFTKDADEGQKAREAAEQADAERQRREEAEREATEARQREEAEARRRDEEKRKAREEDERAREEERRTREAEEIRRKAEAATAAAMAKQAGEPADDIAISDEDLDLDEVKEERKALGFDEKRNKRRAKEAEREAKRKKRAEEKRRRKAEKQAARAPVPSAMRTRRSSSWGRPVALLVAIALVLGIGAAHVVPIDPAPYEQAASQALGRPVRIGSTHLWLFTGVQLRLAGVRVGDTRVGRVITHPALSSLLAERKRFDLIELEGVSLPQAALGEVLFAQLKPGRFSVERIVARKLDLKGGLALPPLDADVALAHDGTLRSATLYGPDGLNARLSPRSGARGDVLDFEATAAGFPLPIGPELTLSQFAMKGTATRQGMDIAEWGGALFNGGISGNAKIRWGNTWHVEGAVTVRAINAAVFAPALLSQGNAEGTGRFTMSSADPAKLLGSSRVEGRFTISRGTLGSFDLSRAIQSRGKQATGTTQFAELTGQASYDRGTVALRNVMIGAGALNAGATADISKSGALSGRIVADVKTAAQTLSATLNLGGTVKEPQVRD